MDFIARLSKISAEKLKILLLYRFYRFFQEFFFSVNVDTIFCVSNKQNVINENRNFDISILSFETHFYGIIILNLVFFFFWWCSFHKRLIYINSRIHYFFFLWVISLYFVFAKFWIPSLTKDLIKTKQCMPLMKIL